MTTTTRPVATATRTAAASRNPSRIGAALGRIAAGAATGLALGVAARLFMRLLTDEPEFSWSGTLLIVGIFTTFGTVQGLVAAVRAATRRRWITAPARLLGAFSFLLLGGGAGMVMLPFLWTAAPAAARGRWPRWLRGVLFGAASLNLLAVAVLGVRELGLGLGPMAGLALLTATYVATVRVAHPTFGPRPAAAG